MIIILEGYVPQKEFKRKTKKKDKDNEIINTSLKFKKNLLSKKVCNLNNKSFNTNLGDNYK